MNIESWLRTMRFACHNFVGAESEARNTFRQGTHLSMPPSRQYLSKWFRWRSGRQETGYEKMLFLVNPFIIPFDVYLLRFREGSEIPEHTDPVSDRRHFRLNIILRNAREGGDFVCSDPIFENRRIKLFRPDLSAHSVTKILRGTRYVLSIGWARK